MDRYSILDPPASSTTKDVVSKKNGTRVKTESPSAGIAAVSAPPQAKSAGSSPRFPGEDSGRSLAEMAHADLDAALQLLADRAQYITGASGAAIALRRGGHEDLICRASVGANAPELGTLLSMEYGLSGESVRTRKLLRCDDAERDSRVNRELCRQLGIASVVVMPLLQEQQVLGVFELLCGKPNAFNDRDLSALTRLGEMVLTAVKHSEFVLGAPAASEPPSAKKAAANTVAPRLPQAGSISSLASDSISGSTDLLARAAVPASNSVEEKKSVEVVEKPLKQEKAADAAKKPLFWSAALKASETTKPSETDQIPSVLRNLQKCKACGFPVSQGRTYCVECEEKQWRGHPLPQKTPVESSQPSAVSAPAETQTPKQLEIVAVSDVPEPTVPAQAQEKVLAMAAAASTAPSFTVQSLNTNTVTEIAAGQTSLPEVPVQTALDSPAADSNETDSHENANSFLSSALPTESWLSANKYVLFAVAAVVAIVAGVFLFH
jgi:putative methionine-R-sulfoxide reductase with GAF domain